LLSLPLPGNQYELEVLVHRAVSRATGPPVRLADLDAEAAHVSDPARDQHPLDASAHEVERRMLLRALERAGGNKSEAARLLGLKRTTSADKCRRHGLADTPSIRPGAP